MPERVKSGFRGRPDRCSLIVAEFRAQELGDQVRELRRDLIRLRAAVRDYLTALPSDKPRAHAHLRHEMGRRAPAGEAA